MEVRTVIKSGSIPTICRQCDMRCGIKVDIENDRMVRISGLDSHPQNEGRVCPKGRKAIETVCHEERLVKPLKRTAGGSFQEIPLSRAMDEIAGKLLAIKENHGARSLGCWHGEALGFAQQEKYPRRFAHAFGSPNFFSCNSLCWASRYMAYGLVQGYWNPQPDFARAGLIILWGSNPPLSHPNFMGPIDEGRKKGAKLIVIDPRLTQIAKKADVHLRPMPGTDGALAWGLIRFLIEGKSYDSEFVKKYSTGFEDLAASAQAFTPEFAAQKTGLTSPELLECGRMVFKSLPRVANYVGVSLEHQDNGFNSIRAIACFGGLCGAVDIQGGDLWPEGMGERDLGLYDQLPLADQKPVGADKFPVLYDLVKDCHTMTGIDWMLGNGEYPLRAMIVTGGNPVSTQPNSGKVARAFSGLDLLVVRDLFLTKTAELAHYVLPAASFLERSELHLYSHIQWVSLSKKVIQIPEAVDEYSFWRDLAVRLGFGEKYFPWETESEVNRWLLEPTGVSPAELMKRPEGLRYKSIQYKKFLTRPFLTPSGKFEFSSKYLKDLGFSGIPEYVEPYHVRLKTSDFPLTLISGARKMAYTNSRFRNIAPLRQLAPFPEVEIHPEDAAKSGIKNEDRVRVTSAVGALEIRAKVVDDEEILGGVLQITHGWDDANVNLITNDSILDPISGFPLLKSVPVKIEKVK